MGAGRGGLLVAGRGPPAAATAAARRGVRGSAGTEAARTARRAGTPGAAKCAAGFRSGPGVVRWSAARGGVAMLEVDGVGRKHRATKTHRSRRRQPGPVDNGI